MEDEKIIDEGTQDVAESAEATTEAVEQESTAIPPELEGIDDDEIVKEVMAEAKGVTVEEMEKPAAPVDKAAPGPIPYTRFKEKVDESKAKDAEIAGLRRQLEAYKQAPQYQPQPTPQAQPQQVQARPQAPQNNGIQLTPENMKLINDAIQREAQAIAQLPKEDMESLEYMEDDDPRKLRWQYAQEMARGNIFDRIRQAQAVKAEQARRFMEAHNRSVADFNAYAQQAMSEPDFEEVKNFAINDFFKALPTQEDKMVIASAYARVEQNTASPEDIYLVKNFYMQAQTAYHAKQGKTTNNQSKAEQASKFPRSQQVAGSGDAGGGVTIASLEKMLNEMPFDQIDPKYQKLLLGE